MIAYGIQWLRSLFYSISLYTSMFVIGIAYFPFALFSRRAAFGACHAFCGYAIWSARWIVGIKTEVRGTPPTEECMIAAKHQSFFDIIVIFNSVPRGKFIMKRELLFAPVLGQYAWRIGCVPVDRGKRGRAVMKMVADVIHGMQRAGQLIIYPQGTRVAPGVAAPYKVGTGVLYEQLGQPCYPVATNVGLFWPKRAVMRKPGRAVVEFLEPIPAGVDKASFLAQLSRQVEERSIELMAEAGFHTPPEGNALTASAGGARSLRDGAGTNVPGPEGTLDTGTAEGGAVAGLGAAPGPGDLDDDPLSPMPGPVRGPISEAGEDPAPDGPEKTTGKETDS
ncbi:hypothetical protein BV394_07360 [Brevirhabdus pacifica]|uniref:Uncharacterized protein n=2 Tax=Brevirhabdus pacifica TaxID=1267768 RepID=A0A1U7DHU0_9RHOB|nr:hypothetical protein BV394_07360 [Brevirhabdus pacifica]PJJ85784.1 1-acyl-sn-glycerol-3-phosphate acyltransferase [Brevirhabdus pacifica]